LVKAVMLEFTCTLPGSNVENIHQFVKL